MDQQQLKSALESILFVSSKPLSVRELAKIMEIDAGEIKSALHELAQERKNAGVVVLEHEEVYQLATNSHNSTVVKNFLNAELREKLTDATVEVLAIIAYRQPISKAEIEAIRGVNSQYSLRVLLMRGLVEKIANPNDARGVLYQTTTEFLQHLGLTTLGDLPEFEKLVADIKLPETPPLQNEPPSPEEEADAASEDTGPNQNLPDEIIVVEQAEAAPIAPETEPMEEASTPPDIAAEEIPDELDEEEEDDDEDEDDEE